eukprot:jgi/Mesen1/4502/ME000023S03879
MSAGVGGAETVGASITGSPGAGGVTAGAGGGQRSARAGSVGSGGAGGGEGVWPWAVLAHVQDDVDDAGAPVYRQFPRGAEKGLQEWLEELPELLVREITADMYAQAFRDHWPALVLFIDRASPSEPVRAGGRAALLAVREAARHYKEIARREWQQAREWARQARAQTPPRKRKKSKKQKQKQEQKLK